MAGIVKCTVALLLLSVSVEVAFGQTCSITDSFALQYFYREFVYCRNEFATWDPSTNCCGWEGVTCDGSGSVTALTIENANQTLPYPADSLFYYIETGVLALKKLVFLKMTNVAFNGGIPPSWGTGLTNIQTLILDGCNIVGPMPEELCNLKGITTFSMRNNLFTGSLPECMKDPYQTFPNLKSWDLSGNNFS